MAYSTEPIQLSNEEIREKLLDIYKELGFKLSNLERVSEPDNFSFRYKKILYNVNWQDGPEDIYYSIEEIEDCNYSEDFLQNEYQHSTISEFEDFLSSIKEGRWDVLRKVWIALDVLEDKFCEDLPQSWDDIIREKYGLY